MKKLTLAALLVASTAPAFAAPGAAGIVAPEDTRVTVEFDDAVKQVLLERMRHHLSDIYEIQEALAKSNFNRVAEIAEYSLGLSSLGPQNTRIGPYMPAPMQQLGMEVHRASSRLAVVAQEGDMAKALESLTEVTGKCVACHAVYRTK